MSGTDSDRILGELTGTLRQLTGNVERILDNQEQARAEVKSMGEALTEKLERHSEADEKAFTLIRDGIGVLRDRISRLENIADTVESHGEAIVQIETWREKSDGERQALAAVREANRNWARGVIGAVGVAAGATGVKAAPGFWKWLASLFHT